MNNDKNNDRIHKERIHSGRNENGKRCCYLCEEPAFRGGKRIAIGRYEWEHDIKYLICGVNCERLGEHLRGRCKTCGVVVDIGFYRDLPREMTCANC